MLIILCRFGVNVHKILFYVVLRELFYIKIQAFNNSDIFIHKLLNKIEVLQIHKLS